MRSIVLLDGGLGQEIFRRAEEPAHPLWSAKVMMNQPDIVKEVHKDFIRAGACVITINTYTCTPTRLQRDGEPQWFEKLQLQALKIATDARAELGQIVQVAGCLPPLVGSYTSDERAFQALKEEYEQIVAIQAPMVDLFIIETISNIKEAKAATEAALDSDKPVVLSFTLSDKAPDKLRSGESMGEALHSISDYSLDALLFNCSFPETITEGLKSLKHLDIPYGGYGNGFASVEPLKPGGTVDALSTRKDLDEEKYGAYAMNWINNGASVIGGCCEVGPLHIRYLKEQLNSAGYQIVPFR
ncbi:MAG TPA: homocysteine S-methyltransferase family protein [Cyclobacteriaceae bacterium]